MPAQSLKLDRLSLGLLTPPRSRAVVEPQAPSRQVRLEMAPELVRRCRDGEAGAFDELVDETQDHVYNLALYFSGDEDVAADVTQDVFLKVLDRFGQFREEAELTTWLYRVVYNTFLDHRRGQRPVTPLEPAEESATAPELTLEAPQEQAAADAETVAAVRRAVAGLKPKWRAPVALRYGAGLSYEEIAEVLGVSPGTVASRLHRAHARLARTLGHLRPFV